MIKQIAGHTVSGQTGSGISATGAATTIAGFLADIPWVTVVGMMVAVFGFLINAYFGWRKDQREAREFVLKEQVYKSQIRHCECKDGGKDAKQE